jgi:hypothetical protein
MKKAIKNDNNTKTNKIDGAIGLTEAKFTDYIEYGRLQREYVNNRNVNYRLIQLSKGQFVKVDPDDFDRLSAHKWYASKPRLNKTFYACRKSFNRDLNGNIIRTHVLMHREIMGAIGHSEKVDHRNHDTLDNRKGDLRKCTHAQNLGNVISVTNKTGFKGVQKIGPTKFTAYIKNKYIGHFSTAELAALAYNKKALEIYGEFAYLNKIESSKF